MFKLGDFGLARILSTETQLAKTNVGTPYYMAPEQVNELPYNGRKFSKLCTTAT
jgi:serine/threonine protein kinase